MGTTFVYLVFINYAVYLLKACIAHTMASEVSIYRSTIHEIMRYNFIHIPLRSLLWGSLFFMGLIIMTPLENAHAQDAVRRSPLEAAPKQSTVLEDHDGVIHVTGRLNQTPRARQALEAFHRRKAQGFAVSNKLESQGSLMVGARATFRVQNNVVTNPGWVEKEFVLKATSGIANIWVEEGELNNANVEDSDIAALDEALLQQTPGGSINPAKGIVANNNDYFGAPPNVDGDGQLDILLYDIEEGTTNSNAFVAGYVHSGDLSPAGGGNNKDVLYLDTNPGVSNRPIEFILSTAAHEYQHLIHFNYDSSFLELAFTNEGLSEWAEVLNGYPARNMLFLRDPSTYNVPLFGFRSGDEVLFDYQRAGLFTGYLAQRLGPEATGSITRQAPRGRAGYEAVIDQTNLNFTELLKDFHTANFLNDDALSDAYSYIRETYAGIGTVANEPVDGRSFDASLNSIFVESGSAVFLAWNNVANFTLDLDTIDDLNTLRNRMAVRVLTTQNGVTSLDDYTLPMASVTFDGSYEQIAVIAMHVQPELTSRVGIEYEAHWSSDVEGMIANVAYDDGEAVSGNFFSLSAGSEGAVATRFEAPPESQLLEVNIAPFFVSQFSNGGQSTDAPRDLILKIWSVALSGEPGAVLFSLPIDDPRAYTAAALTLNHFSVDLTPYADEMAQLPDAFYIGYSEAGTDENYTVVGPSANEEADVSYVTRGNGDWGKLWDIQFVGEPEDQFPLRGTVIPVRAVFEVPLEPVSNEEDGVLPQTLALEQNYPNPFSQSTTIQFETPEAGSVRIAVYNALGQQVRLLEDGFRAAGKHVVALDADSLPSGLYLYRLETENQTLTRRMLIVR